MRNFLRPVPFLALTTAALALLTACNRQPSDSAPPAGTNTPANAAPKPADTAQTPTASQTPIKDAIEAALAKNPDNFPKNVKLLGADLKEGVVTLDFSAEFQQLANMGDATESQAQKTLRAALQSIPEAQKMRVTVKGGAFDSQATDWMTPFPIRATEGEKQPEQNARSGREGGQ